MSLLISFTVLALVVLLAVTYHNAKLVPSAPRFTTFELHAPAWRNDSYLDDCRTFADALKWAASEWMYASTRLVIYREQRIRLPFGWSLTRSRQVWESMTEAAEDAANRDDKYGALV